MSLYNNLNKQRQSEDLQDQTRSIRNDVTNKPVTSIGTRIADKAFDKVQTDRNLVQQYTGLSDFSGKETAMITAAMSNSDNPSETANKFMQALTYSHYKGIDFETAYNNLDALNAAQLNHKADYTLSTTESLRNSFQIGKLAEERNNLQAQFKQLDMAGQDTTEIVNQINAIDQKMYDLKDDTPRWITTKAAKLVGENWAYMKKVAVSGLTIGLGTALAATGVGAIAGVPMTTAAIGEIASLTAMAYSAASTAGTIKGSSDWYENESYYKWRQKGVSKNTADWGSKLGGVVQGIIESALGASAKAMILTGAQRIGVNLTDDFVRGISNAVGSRLNLSGTTEALLYSGLKYIADGNENGLEEVVQGGADNLASAIVYELDDIPVSEREYESLKDLGEEYIGGFLMGAFLDVPTIPVDFIKYKNNVDADASLMQTIKYVKYLKNDAQYIDSEKAFIDKHVEDSFLDPGVSESDKRNYLEKIWQKNHEEGISETMTEAEAATYEVDTSINDAYESENNNGNPVEPQTSEPLPAPKRLDDGRIRVQDSTKVSQNADGTETRVLNIGTTDSNRNYGSIKYTIDPQNQKITIDGVTQIIGQEDLAREGIIELARRNEGWEIEWNPTTTAQQKIKDQIVNDPANTNKGKLNWFRSDKDVSTNVMVAQEIKKTFKNVSQKESIVMANLLQFKAEAEGKDLRTWMNDHVKSMSVLTDAENTKNVKGAIDLDEKAVKGVIWAGEKADFTTLEHEFFHLASVTDTKASANLANTLKESSNDPEFKKYLNSHRQIIKMDPDEAIEALKNIGTDPSKWNRAQKEITATLFESYQREGKTFNNKLKNLFEQIAEWFHRIYRTLKGENMLNDDIIKAYDAFFDKDASFREAAHKSEIKEQNITTDSNQAGEAITAPKFQTGDTTLFQLENEIDDSYIQEAKNFETKDEFILFEQTMGFGESLSEEKLGEYWDKAHGLYEVKKDPYKSPITEGMSDDEKDDVFKSIMSTDEGVKAFIENLREAASLKLDAKKNNGRIEAFSQDEYYDILQKIQNADLIDSLDYFISNLAYSTKELTPTQIKQVRTMINNSVRDYRSVYGQIIGDENFAVGVYAPVMPDIQDSRAAGMRIPQRKDLVKKLEGTQIREEVRKGTEKYDGTAEKVMTVYDQELKDLQAQYDKLKVDYDKTYLSLSVAQRDAFNKQEKIKKMESAIAKETRIVRNKLDAGLRADTTKLNNWQDELDLLHEEIKDLRKQEAVKSASEKKAVLDALKQEIKDKQLEKAAVEEVHRYKRDLLSSIIAPVSNNVDYSYVEKINELRGMLGNVSGYQNDSITVDGKPMKLADFRKAIEDGTIKIEGLTDYQLKRYLNTSLADLTISDLETLKDTIDYYKQMGKQMWQAKVDKRHFEIQQMQNRFVADLMKNRHYKAPENLPNSVESQKANKGVMATLRLGLIKSLNMNRKFQMLANDTEGAIWQFAVQKKRDLQSQELAAKDARVNPLEAKRKELGVEWKEIYETIVPINLSVNGYNMNQNYTLSDLIYGLMAQKEDRNKQAFMYGDLVSANEKDDIKRRIGTDERANDYIKELGNKRNKLFVDQATAILEEHPNVMKLAEAYDADFQKQGKRLFDLSVEQYNKPMEQVEHYLPIMRQDFNGTDLAQKLADDLYNQNAGKGKTTPNKGMMKQRIDISPDHQTPTKLDFFNTWYESMNAQEHLIHTLGYSRDLNAVFKNYGSRELRSAIENTYGQGMLTDIDNYINEISNPNVFTDTQGINKIIKLLRGGEYTGYLGFKASSIVTQAITSPAAFLQYVSPAELVKGLMKMTSQPEKTWANICQLSPMMMHRSMDPVIDEIGKMASEIGSSDIKKLYGKFLEIGTTGLEMIDRWAVAGGWLACYEKKLSEFEYQSDPKAIKEAVKYADKAVLDSQPVSDLTEIAPIFKSKSEFAKAFTKFQVSLNVIWNNVIYDNGIKAISNLRNSEIDTATKKQIFGKMVGCLAGYAFAGALLTMVQRGKKEDDDKEKVIKDLIYGMTTQFTSAVPFISSKVDNLVQSAITGEKGYEYSSSLYPALDKIFSGVSSLVTLDKNDKDYEKRFKRSLLNITEGAALMGGAPTSGIKEIGYIFTKDGLRESIINGDAELTFNPGALLGQR